MKLHEEMMINARNWGAWHFHTNLDLDSKLRYFYHTHTHSLSQDFVLHHCYTVQV